MTPRHRIRLRLDSLEDRFAPATLTGFTQSTIALTAAFEMQFPETPAPRVAVIAQPPTAIVASAPPSIGFFHVFAQNGFCGGEFIDKAPLPPRPSPVTPPALPASLPQGPPRDIPETTALPELPQSNDAPTAPLDAPPPLAPIPAAAAPLQPQAQPPRTTEPIKLLETTNDTMPAPQMSNFGVAAITGLFAANYLASRQVRERCYDDIFAMDS
jgi:hypothetical protein